jgi:hypothetical protein
LHETQQKESIDLPTSCEDLRRIFSLRERERKRKNERRAWRKKEKEERRGEREERTSKK